MDMFEQKYEEQVEREAPLATRTKFIFTKLRMTPGTNTVSRLSIICSCVGTESPPSSAVVP